MASPVYAQNSRKPILPLQSNKSRLPDPVYGELQKVLNANRRPVARHDGLRTNVMIKSSREGQLTPNAVMNLFDSLLKNINSLFSQSINDKRLCRAIFKDINTIVTFTEKTLQEGRKIDSQLNQDLIYSQKEFAIASQSLNNNKAVLRNLEITLRHFNHKKSSLEEECNKNKALIKVVTEKKAYDEQVRSHALVGLIPFVEMVKGLRAKQFERIIPFYTPVRGVISKVRQTVENYGRKLNDLTHTEHKLTSDINSISLSIKKQKEKISEIEAKINSFKFQIESKDKDIKQLGKDLTVLRNIMMSLKKIASNCKFLKLNIKDTIEFVEVAGNVTKEEVQGLLVSVKEIQQAFNNTFSQRIINRKVASLFSIHFRAALPHDKS